MLRDFLKEKEIGCIQYVFVYPNIPKNKVDNFQNIFLMVFYRKKKSVSFLMTLYLVVGKKEFYLQRTTYVEKEYSNQACRC